MEHPYQTAQSVPALFFAQAKRFGNDAFMFAKRERGKPADNWVPLSWDRTAEEIRRLGAALIGLGVSPGDRVAVFAHNEPRWVIADLAVQAAGAVIVPIYPTSTDDQLAYIIKDSGARAILAGEDHLLEQVLRVKPNLPGLENVISLAALDTPNPSVLLYDDIVARADAAHAAEFGQRLAALGPGNVCAIIYTSGTTGEPKGVVLTQKNFTSQIGMLLDATLTNQMMERGIRMSSLCHLPLCHIYGRTSDYFVQMAMGGRIYFAESYQKVPENLLEIRPQMLITIPRLYEKVYEMVMSRTQRLTGFSRFMWDWSMRVGARVVDHLAHGERLPALTALQFSLAGNLVFNKIKKAAGLDRLVFAASGGGALAEATNRFFRAMNLQVGEGYGLTETTSAVTWNSLEFITPPPDNWVYKKGLDYLIDTMVVMQAEGKNPYTHPVGIFKITWAANTVVPKLIQKPGSVGRPCQNTEIRIAEDGEILAKGPQVFRRDLGYFNKPEATQEVFTEDGFFMTGDIGHFEADNFLVITDRKKELLVTAGGKNVAPHPIELELTLDTLIEQACVIGDGKKYLSVLLAPQFDLLERWAKDNNLSFTSREDLIGRPEVKALYKEKVDKVNAKLARWEQLKTFTLLPVNFSEETGELTPTQKMKRRVIHAKFKREIDSLY